GRAGNAAPRAGGAADGNGQAPFSFRGLERGLSRGPPPDARERGRGLRLYRGRGRMEWRGWAGLSGGRAAARVPRRLAGSGAWWRPTQGSSSARGRMRWKVVPWPGALVARIVP